MIQLLRKEPASVYVWSRVSGLPSAKRRKLLIVALQAYIDDSWDEEYFVLAGYIASAENWAAFSDEWQTLLSNHGLQSFKMSQIARMSDGMRPAEIFYRVIERRVMVPISCIVDIKDLKSAINGISWPVDVIEAEKLENPYYTAFHYLIDKVALFNESMELFEPVDFIFDEKTEKKFLLDVWELKKATAAPECRPYYGDAPIWRDDEALLPLQAADFWAWWVRKWETEGKHGLQRRQHLPWKLDRELRAFNVSVNENDIRSGIEEALRPKNKMIASLSNEALRRLDEVNLYEEERREHRAQTSLLTRLRQFLSQFR